MNCRKKLHFLHGKDLFSISIKFNVTLIIFSNLFHINADIKLRVPFTRSHESFKIFLFAEIDKRKFNLTLLEACVNLVIFTNFDFTVICKSRSNTMSVQNRSKYLIPIRIKINLAPDATWTILKYIRPKWTQLSCVSSKRTFPQLAVVNVLKSESIVWKFKSSSLPSLEARELHEDSNVCGLLFT